MIVGSDVTWQDHHEQDQARWQLLQQQIASMHDRLDRMDHTIHVIHHLVDTKSQLYLDRRSLGLVLLGAVVMALGVVVLAVLV